MAGIELMRSDLNGLVGRLQEIQVILWRLFRGQLVGSPNYPFAVNCLGAQIVG